MRQVLECMCFMHPMHDSLKRANMHGLRDYTQNGPILHIDDS